MNSRRGRPLNAFSPKERVCRKLALSRGVTAFQLSFSPTIDETIQQAAEILRQNNLVQPGTPIVIVSDMLSDHFTATSIMLYHA